MSALLKQHCTLRQMLSDDLDDVMVGELESYPFPWTLKNFEDCLANQIYSCWVLEEASKLYGHLVLSTGAKEAHILNLCVYPDYQGKGLGKKILFEAELIAKQRDAETCFLEVRPSNKAGLHLYRSKGYNEIGIRNDYYPDHNGREDAIVMAKHFVLHSF